MRKKRKIINVSSNPMEEIISVSLPNIPDNPKDRKFSKALLGGEITICVDARSDESTKLKCAKELLLREAEAAGQLGIPSHIVPYARGACEIAAEENDNDFQQETQEQLTDIRKNIGQTHPKVSKPKRTLTSNQISDNKLKNELIVEIRRRANAKFGTLGKVGIENAYAEIEQDAMTARSKWRTIISLASKSAILDKARHNKRYTVTQARNRK